MTQMIIHLDRVEFELFKLKVGYGNMSSVIRNYIKNYIGGDKEKEVVLRKKFLMLDEEKKIKDAEWGKLKAKLDSIKQKKDIEDLKRLEEQQKEDKKMKDIVHNTMKENLHRVI